MSDGTRASPWPRRLVGALAVALPLGLGAIGLWHDRGARAQEAPVAAVALEQPGETHLTEEQEKALDVKLVVANLVRGDHPIVSGGRVSLDIEHTARVRPVLNSVIYEVKKHAGDEVKKGDELLVVESTDLGDVKNNYLTALANLEVAAETYKREALLRATRATTETDYHASRAAFRTAVVAAEAAREKCLLLGVSGRELDSLEGELPIASLVPENRGETEPGPGPLAVKPPDDAERDNDARRALREVARRRSHRTQSSDEDSRRRARYTIRAPIDGVLLTRDAARGEYVDPSQVIATVSDLSQLWINVDVYQNDIAKVRIGASVDIVTPTYPDIAFVGTVTFISETVDDTTRTLKARVVVNNPDRLLKSGMAAKTTVHCVETQPRIELPPEAIVREGEDTYVVVKKGPGHYVRRRVKLGLEAQDAVHVDSGLVEGETVVQGGNLFIHTKIPMGD